ncbi:MAG: polyamine aminopropyltransferase [Christensenellaceae bacterium]|jgi:spermidine synthase
MAGTWNDKWFYEEYSEGARFGIRIKEHLVDDASDYQKIDFFDSYEFGRFFTLDGFIMITEKDEFIYHEMIVHVPMATCLEAKTALVIGGGDGGTVRELTRYKTLERIDMVEIDEKVVSLCKQYLPKTAAGFSDRRVHLHFEDGVKWVKNCTQSYDIIIIDSTDPIGVGEGLFTQAFYLDCRRILNENGVLINQHESPYYEGDAKMMERAHKRIDCVFPVARVYQFHMPTYASGHWLFGYASKGKDPLKDLSEAAWNKLGIATDYYNTQLHKGCFALPNYVKKRLNTAVAES